MDKSPKPVAAIAPFGLRMQPALKSALEEAAKSNARSLNGEIVERLERSFSSHSNELSPEALAILAGIQFQFAATRLQLWRKEARWQELKEPIRDLLKLVEDHDLEDGGYDFFELEQMVNERSYSEDALQAKILEAEEDLAKAEKTMREKASAMIEKLTSDGS